MNRLSSRDSLYEHRAATPGIVVGEKSQVARRRAICEYYRSPLVAPVSHKVLRNPRIICDSYAADG